MGDVTRSRKKVTQRFLERTFRGRPMGIGSYVWMFQRLTGLVLAFYLGLHLLVLGSALKGGASFNQVMAMLETPWIKVLETALVWVALFHTANGIRLVLLDLVPSLNQRSLAYGALVVTIVLGAMGTSFMW